MSASAVEKNFTFYLVDDCLVFFICLYFNSKSVCFALYLLFHYFVIRLAKNLRALTVPCELVTEIVLARVEWPYYVHFSGYCFNLLSTAFANHNLK